MVIKYTKRALEFLDMIKPTIYDHLIILKE